MRRLAGAGADARLYVAPDTTMLWGGFIRFLEGNERSAFRLHRFDHVAIPREQRFQVLQELVSFALSRNNLNTLSYCRAGLAAAGFFASALRMSSISSSRMAAGSMFALSRDATHARILASVRLGSRSRSVAR